MALFIEKQVHNSKEAPKNDRTLLVDADTICFHSILQCTSEEILMDRNFYSDEAWEKVLEEEGYNPDTNTVRKLNFEQAKKAFDFKVESLMSATGCKDFELYLTGTFPTFRHYIIPEYKSDRKGSQRPLRLAEFKMWAVLNRAAIIRPDIEADELLGDKFLKDPDKYIVASVDKDLLLQLPGTKFDYYNKRFHIVENNEFDATYWFHHRLLMGDRGDYLLTGLTRVGEKTATKLLTSVRSKQENYTDVQTYKEDLYKLVRKEYIRQGVNRLHLMHATIGADNLVNGVVCFHKPAFTNVLLCPFCQHKKLEHESDCGDHELPECPKAFEPLGSSSDTHLMQGIGAKKSMYFRLYKQWLQDLPKEFAPELDDLGFFYQFVAATKSTTMGEIKEKYEELKDA